MGYLDKAVSTVKESVSAPTKSGIAATAGYVLGGPAGAVPGGLSQVGGKLGGVIKNTPLDYRTYKDAWGQVWDKVTGKRVEGGPNPNAGKMPQLGKFSQLSDLGGKGVIAAPQVGASPWMQMAMQKQGADQARGLDASVQNQAQALAAGRASNPRGLMSGSAENMSGQGLLDTVKMRQNMALQNAMGNAGVQMQGAGKETDLNQFNAGLNNQASQANISNSLQDLTNQNQNNAYKYGEVMKMKAADATSQGVAKSGGGGKK